jgi:hypothetical protein
VYNYWTGSAPVARFTKSDDCAKAYRNLMCFLAFPRCDDSGESMNMCRSTCENMMRSCGYDKDLWRCYEPQFYGGKRAEGTDGDQLLDKDGAPFYTRAVFPGSPFTPNQFSGDDPVPVCTPSLIDGATAALSGSSLGPLAALLGALALALAWQAV